ncbi:SAM-dependent methyltransferase [Streptomyces sp. SID8366]|uniref:class I SAM-dependent methyltransferase n=1 Tax=unclassified Streptomyces TaxID=2593676 RepID=UPI000DB9DBD9|nr:class I SAM-dependent methyltransferase [Streptomyces sp. PsTaAH-130]MYU08532.1 SAM-dependent methyltransferase [Streptomyces sp. SID8366]MYU63256.1 SAM-dependent methyltransferase [Streptomyces sp. SID69]RAJ62919.1 methyltransferase (TIGR00027 family) [Streptomyces sp. PsTaAH-130]
MSENERAASRTAVLVCQGRAAADGRTAVGRFADPVAVRLLRAEERVRVDEVRAGTPPRGWQARTAYESVRACAEVVGARTVAIDEALRARPAGQLVILGAGLDTRAWRLAELARTDVWEVDHPASQRDKRARLGAAEPAPVALARSVRFTPVDFAADGLGAALDAAGHDPAAPTTWLWEGVVPYLTRDQVRATLRALTARTAPGSTLVVNYQTPSPKATAGRLLARLLGSSATAGEPWLSLWTPRQMAALLTEYGLRVTSDDGLLAVARTLGTPARNRTSLDSGRVAVAESG